MSATRATAADEREQTARSDESGAGVEELPLGPALEVMRQLWRLNHAIERHPSKVFFGIEAVVLAAHEDVVYVEKDPAVGALGDLSDELPLGEGALFVGEVARDVLDREGNADGVFDGTNPVDDVSHDLGTIRERQEIVRFAAAHPGKAEVVGEPGGPRGSNDAAKVREVGGIEGIGAADRKRDAVRNERPSREKIVEPAPGRASLGEEVLADDLEPIDCRRGARSRAGEPGRNGAWTLATIGRTHGKSRAKIGVVRRPGTDADA